MLNDLRNVIQEPTRVTNQTATLIGSVLISSSVSDFDPGILDVQDKRSDHLATYIYSSLSIWYSLLHTNVNFGCIVGLNLTDSVAISQFDCPLLYRTQ